MRAGVREAGGKGKGKEGARIIEKEFGGTNEDSYLQGSVTKSVKDDISEGEDCGKRIDKEIKNGGAGSSRDNLVDCEEPKEHGESG